MGSLDVDALFIRTPLNETTNICTSQLFTENELINNRCKEDIRIFLELACKETLFIFNGGTASPN